MNKGRSFLTMLGIIIGVAAVIIIIAVGAGAQSLIFAQFKSFGTDLVGILPGKTEDEGPPATLYGIVITTLTYKDAQALESPNNVPNAKVVAAYVKGVGTASWGPNSYDTNFNGTTANYMDVEGGEVEYGRFFTEDEEKSIARVAVIGYKVKQELFGDTDPVGKRIKIKKHSFDVIGVMKERGTVAFQDYDDQIHIPIITAQKVIEGIDYVNMIRVKVDNDANVTQAMDDIAKTLRIRHDIDDPSGKSDDFSVRSMSQAMEAMTAITDALKYFLAAMAALSLLVGGIGIMNIMLVTVTERTREIGLRKAIGANRKNILGQFLIESVTITMIGGLIGISFGFIVSYLVAVAAKALGYDWEFVVSAFSVILSVAVSSSVGLAFGIYPAYKASKLDPIEALRYE